MKLTKRGDTNGSTERAENIDALFSDALIKQFLRPNSKIDIDTENPLLSKVFLENAWTIECPVVARQDNLLDSVEQSIKNTQLKVSVRANGAEKTEEAVYDGSNKYTQQQWHIDEVFELYLQSWRQNLSISDKKYKITYNILTNHQAFKLLANALHVSKLCII